MTVKVDEVPLQKTPRREARENYARFLLKRAGCTDEDAESFLHEKQDSLFGRSPYELIYTGQFEWAVETVEKLTEDLEKEDLTDGFADLRRSTSDSPEPSKSAPRKTSYT